MNPSEETILEAAGLAKSFLSPHGDRLAVLGDLSLRIPRGAIVGILGASGCGKSTLLRILAGIDWPDSGKITSKLLRPGPQIGFQQQSERLLPWRTVLQNAALGLELIGQSKDKAARAAEKMLEAVGLAEFAETYPAQLSGGMTQRALLARTLITSPSLLLLDEPLGQLDVVGRKALAANIRDYVQKHSAGAVLVTHSVEEAVFISDIVLTISRRPAIVTNRFILNPEFALDGVPAISRSTCFDAVLNSLLQALGESSIQGGATP